MKFEKIFITGATGFVGKNLLNQLVAGGYSVVALARDPSKVEAVTAISFDLNNSSTWDFTIPSGSMLIHCAWQDVRDVESMTHLKDHYRKHYLFLEHLINRGLENIMIMGSCYEYGLQYGPISSTKETMPNTPYAVAKDTLHKSLRLMQGKKKFNLIWARLFYLYGSFQDPKCIIPQFDAALDRGDEFFNMSLGEQLLDYLNVEKAAQILIDLIDRVNGTFNVCSGTPISLRRLLEERMRKKNKFIKLNLGFYRYREQDSIAIWGIQNSEAPKGTI